MNNIENINLINSLQNSKSSEYTINKLIQEQQTEINKLNTNTQLNQQIKNELGEGVGPYRVWKRGEGYPGLAMSRSIGDLNGIAALSSSSDKCSISFELIDLLFFSESVLSNSIGGGGLILSKSNLS